MRDFLAHNFDHVLFVLLLISRLGDVGSTYLATPALKLEANPIAKRLGWRFAVLTILVAFVPYWNTRIAVVLLVPFLLVSAENIGKIWMVRSLGENEYANLQLRLARKGKLRHAITGVMASSFFVILVGGLLWFLCPDAGMNWGYWVGIGIMLYGLVKAFWGSWYYVGLFRTATKESVKLSMNGRPEAVAPEIVARCGFICSQCPAYQGNIESDMDLQQAAKKWLRYYGFQLSPEEMVCDGCMKPDTENPTRVTRDCHIRNCVLQKKIENCAYCDEYPCGLMKNRIADFEEIRNRHESSIGEDEYTKYFRPYDVRTTVEQIRAKLKRTLDA